MGREVIESVQCREAWLLFWPPRNWLASGFTYASSCDSETKDRRSSGLQIRASPSSLATAATHSFASTESSSKLSESCARQAREWQANLFAVVACLLPDNATHGKRRIRTVFLRRI